MRILKTRMKNKKYQRPVPISSSLEIINNSFFLLFLFFLPLYEAPKNIFSGLFVILGIWIAFRKKAILAPFKEKNIVVWAFLLLILSPFLAGIDSPYVEFRDRFASALNWALMPAVGLVLILVQPPNYLVRYAFRVIVLGSIIAIFHGLVTWVGLYPELNSVGHVNQSALYLSFSLFAALWILGYKHSSLDVALVIAHFLFILAFMAPARSLVAIITLAMILACWFTMEMICRKHYVMMIFSLVIAGFGVMMTIAVPPNYFGPFEDLKAELDERLASGTNPFSQRDRLLHSALEVGSDAFTGFGLGSFGKATHFSQLEESVNERDGEWKKEKGKFYTSSHGHNIFSNILVERGIVGVSFVAGFLGILSAFYVSRLRAREAQRGLLLVFTICFAGLGQSTLHVEHGQLAFVLLSLNIIIINDQIWSERCLET